MRTITTPKVIIPASTVNVYTYDELPDTAKAAAFNTWVESEQPRHLFNIVLDDIARCIEDFCKTVDVFYTIDPWNNVWLSRNDGIYDHIGAVADNGYYASMDIVDAWNKNVLDMRRALVTFESTDTDSDLDALNKAIDNALADVQTVVQADIDAEFDCYICGKELVYVFEELDAYEHEYTIDGSIY